MKKILILKTLSLSVAISSFVGVILGFIKFSYQWTGLIIFSVMFFITFLILYMFMIKRKRIRIYSGMSHYVDVMYGDILKVKDIKNKPVVVIPVNSSFDWIVDENNGKKNPVVDPTSIHGQWLNKYAYDYGSLNNLKNKIITGIKNAGIKPRKKLPKTRGNKKAYDVGSYIFVEQNDCTYLLFALTEFDIKNKVKESNAHHFALLMNELVESFGRCPNRDVFVPIMGDNIGLFGIDTKESYGYIKSSVLNCKNYLRSNVIIVIYEKNKEKISLYD